ncbi:MAG: YIP1 family protein [Gammaproteobacteria bacterium]|nr:YIP1 family protein [Gammaproteobacteria bacterium]
MQPEPRIPAAGEAGAGGIIERIKAILTSPRSEWPVIAAEPATVAGLYTRYIMWLAAIPAVFGFIKGSLIGHSMFGISVSTPVLAGLLGMVLGYVLGLVVLYLVSMIVNALAPTFGGRKDQVQALKAVGYAWTAAWVAGIAVILPWVGWLVALAGGIYSIWLLYLGLPHTMKSAPEKSLAYTAVTVVCALLLSWVVGLVVAGVTGVGAMAAGAMAGTGGNNVRVDADSRLGQLAEMGRRMEEAGRQVELARASGDAGAEGRALGAMMGAVAGGGADGSPVEVAAPDQLRALLPEKLGRFERKSVSASRSGAMGMQVSEASADYATADGSSRVSVQITDMAAVAGMMAMAGAFSVDQSSETDDGYERTYTRDGRLVSEEWSSRTGHGKYSSTVANRFQVEARGQADSIDELRDIVGGIDRQLAALQ